MELKRAQAGQPGLETEPLTAGQKIRQRPGTPRYLATDGVDGARARWQLQGPAPQMARSQLFRRVRGANESTPTKAQPLENASSPSFWPTTRGISFIWGHSSVPHDVFRMAGRDTGPARVVVVADGRLHVGQHTALGFPASSLAAPKATLGQGWQGFEPSRERTAADHDRLNLRQTTVDGALRFVKLKVRGAATYYADRFTGTVYEGSSDGRVSHMYQAVQPTHQG